MGRGGAAQVPEPQRAVPRAGDEEGELGHPGEVPHGRVVRSHLHLRVRPQVPPLRLLVAAGGEDGAAVRVPGAAQGGSVVGESRPRRARAVRLHLVAAHLQCGGEGGGKGSVRRARTGEQGEEEAGVLGCPTTSPQGSSASGSTPARSRRPSAGSRAAGGARVRASGEQERGLGGAGALACRCWGWAAAAGGLAQRRTSLQARCAKARERGPET